MPNIVFPYSSAPGVRPQESGGRLINAFAEKAPQGAPSDTIIKRTPGLRYLGVTANPTHIHTRGFLDCAGTTALWIVNERVYAVDSSFTITNLGALAGTDPVTTARNNNVTPDNVVVTSAGVFNLFTGGAPTAFADVDLPATPTSVCDFEGFFIWSYGSGAIYASDLNSVAVNPLSLNIEQGLYIHRVVRFGGRLFAFGDKWTGVYRNAGTSPFPLAREATIPRGIVGTHAIAGWENGWANELIWVGDDFRVTRLNGYQAVPLDHPAAVSRDIQTCVLAGDRNLLEAFVYVHENNPIWTLTCHDRFTWEFNLTTGQWNERISYGYHGWRGMKSLRIFNQWLIGSQDTGKLFKIDPAYYREDTDPLIWHVESGVMTGFPNRSFIPRASFHITTGVGDPSLVLDPRVEISWSLDGGSLWGTPLLRRLGRSGETGFHPFVANCGVSRGQGIRYRLRVSDPVWVGLNGGIVDAQNRGVTG